MGVSGLLDLIKKKSDNVAVVERDFLHFAGMVVGIDTSLLVHRMGAGTRSTGQDMLNAEGGLTSHLNGIAYKILKFLENGMTPIFVFDGKPIDLKNNTTKSRESKKAAAKEKMVSAEGDDYVTCFRQSFAPTQKDYMELQIMLDLMGIPYIMAPEEADPVLAWLSTRKDKHGNRFIKGICSEDIDMLAFGAPYLFKNMFQAMKDNSKVSVISLRTTLSKMRMNMNQFVDMVVLMGCDYCERIPTVGPAKAYSTIVAKKNLSGALAQLQEESKKTTSKIKIDPQNAECMHSAAKYFKNVLEDLDNNDKFVVTYHNIRLRQYQEDAFLNFMCVKHNFDVSRIQTMVRRLAACYDKMKVTRQNKVKAHKMIDTDMDLTSPTVEDYEFLSSSSDSA